MCVCVCVGVLLRTDVGAPESSVDGAAKGSEQVLLPSLGHTQAKCLSFSLRSFDRSGKVARETLVESAGLE